MADNKAYLTTTQQQVPNRKALKIDFEQSTKTVQAGGSKRYEFVDLDSDEDEVKLGQCYSFEQALEMQKAGKGYIEYDVWRVPKSSVRSTISNSKQSSQQRSGSTTTTMHQKQASYDSLTFRMSDLENNGNIRVTEMNLSQTDGTFILSSFTRDQQDDSDKTSYTGTFKLKSGIIASDTLELKASSKTVNGVSKVVRSEFEAQYTRESVDLVYSIDGIVHTKLELGHSIVSQKVPGLSFQSITADGITNHYQTQQSNLIGGDYNQYTRSKTTAANSSSYLYRQMNDFSDADVYSGPVHLLNRGEGFTTFFSLWIKVSENTVRFYGSELECKNSPSQPTIQIPASAIERVQQNLNVGLLDLDSGSETQSLKHNMFAFKLRSDFLKLYLNTNWQANSGLPPAEVESMKRGGVTVSDDTKRHIQWYENICEKLYSPLRSPTVRDTEMAATFREYPQYKHYIMNKHIVCSTSNQSIQNMIRAIESITN